MDEDKCRGSGRAFQGLSKRAVGAKWRQVQRARRTEAGLWIELRDRNKKGEEKERERKYAVVVVMMVVLVRTKARAREGEGAR